MPLKVPEWLDWYKKPEYRDIKEYSAHVNAGERPQSPTPAAIPSRLRLDRILANKTCSPMSLYDFYMYLKYIEFSAENLEFYIWYKNYEASYEKGLTPVHTKEYGAISSAAESTSSIVKESQAASSCSPKDPENGDDEDADPEKTLHRISQLIVASAMCNSRSCSPAALQLTPDQSNGKSLQITSCTSDSAPATMKLMNSDGQASRHELDTIIHLFLMPSGEKELNIPAALRAQTLADLQKSTQPSALKPVADHVYGLMHNCSHRNFVRLGVGNGTFETVCVATMLGIANLIAGYVVVMCRAFVPYRGSHTRWEAWAAWPNWWLGVSLILAGLRGSCFFLLLFSKRQRLPWERFDDNTDSVLRNEGGFLKSVSRLMIFDRRLRVKEKYLRRLQRKIVLQSLVGGAIFATIWVTVFIFLPVWKETV
ncbi:hypothetical protein QC761_511470 [Podospora bellae-mahoneyi]|uniref:RGS domain-containing protein n=1 Tax=Podospora bellae-mahoneyi TaxID=2093777 RepID=A0ABR0FGQ6_9PEZI|nr:hypothetical protein QC761_511470 [Podospora bellae-mahoneyi]